MASKLPQQNFDKEELIAATTLFSLTGAEDTRRELQNTLLGNKISYLLIMTEGESHGITPYMVVCPIENLGYIACISNKREDMAIMIMNMKKAAKEVIDILTPRKEMHEIEKVRPVINKIQSIQENPLRDTQYNKILNKIRDLKNIKVSSFIPPSGLKKEVPVPKGSPAIPAPPSSEPKPISTQTKFKSIPLPPKSTAYPQNIQDNTVAPQQVSKLKNIQDFNSYGHSYNHRESFTEPTPHLPGIYKKFRIKFQNEKQITFTMIISAISVEDAIRICQEKNPQFKIVKILEANEIS
ncbi:MAG: hypothetical protein ACTSQO_12405 [Candidatus Helarchaeota archaeon]